MDKQKKTPSGGDRKGVRKIKHPNPIKPTPFPQAPLLWVAHQECFHRLQVDPTPVNRMIAQLVAAQWKDTYKSEVLR
jgi:hypothetical protein